MINKIKNLLLATASLSLLFAPMFAPATAMAQSDTTTGLCQGVNLDPTNANCNPANDQGANDKIKSILATVINIFSLVVGVIAVIMIIIGGLKYITSGGDTSNITAAKNTILYAVIGLVVVALAQFIVRFVLAKVTQ